MVGPLNCSSRNAVRNASFPNCFEQIWLEVTLDCISLVDRLINALFDRAADNWKFLKEVEKAAKVYWNAKDRLHPRVSHLCSFMPAILYAFYWLVLETF